MNIIVDGIIYQLQSQGGISRIYSEILPRMCDLDDSVRITLLTEGKCRQSLPEHKHIVHRKMPPVKRYLRPGRLWKPVITQARQLMIWFSLLLPAGQQNAQNYADFIEADDAILYNMSQRRIISRAIDELIMKRLLSRAIG
jgi:hypothetical protein